MSGSLNTQRHASGSSLCAIKTSSSPCLREGAILVGWSILYPSVRSCVKHAEGRIFKGIAAKEKPDPKAMRVIPGDEEYRRQAFEEGRRLTCRRPQCRAKPGTQCVTRGGKPAAYDHGERFYDGERKASEKRSKAWRE